MQFSCNGICKIGLFLIGEPGHLRRVILDPKEKDKGEEHRRYCFKHEEHLPAVQSEERNLQQRPRERRSDDRRDDERCEHERSRPCAFALRKPCGEENGVDHRIETCLRRAEQEAADEEAGLGLDEGERCRDHAPCEHDARDPLCGERARYLEDEVANEEDARAHAEDFGRQPRQILLHRQFCIGDVHAVDTRDDRDEKDGEHHVQIAFSLELCKLCIRHATYL